MRRRPMPANIGEPVQLSLVISRRDHRQPPKLRGRKLIRCIEQRFRNDALPIVAKDAIQFALGEL